MLRYVGYLCMSCSKPSRRSFYRLSSELAGSSVTRCFLCRDVSQNHNIPSVDIVKLSYYSTGNRVVECNACAGLVKAVSAVPTKPTVGKWLLIASYVKCFRQEPRSRRLAVTASARQHFLPALRLRYTYAIRITCGASARRRVAGYHSRKPQTPEIQTKLLVIVFT